MNNKFLSIIIPAYNAEKYIYECLTSLNRILAEEIEIIVVNDGSSDNTLKVVDQCIYEDKRIEVLSVQNGGVAKARNIGLEHASGEYIMFLDADDYLLSEAFDHLLNILNENRYEFIAFSRMIIEDGKNSWTDAFYFKGAETSDKNIMDAIMYTDSHFNECWGKIYKKEILDRFMVRFPEGVPIGEDLMFVMEYYSHCKNVYASNMPIVAYRQHNASAMRKYNLSDRLKLTRNLLYFTKKYVPEQLSDEYWYYNFKILTNLCREYSDNLVDKENIRIIYLSDITEEVLQKIKVSSIPLYRKHELFFMQKKWYLISAIYYYFKSKIGR